MTRGDRQRPGLVATDLDGTLLRSDGTISRRTVAALAAVEEAGVPLVFVTGRPPRWMHEVAEATGHHGVAVCANGAVVYDVHTEQVVASYPLAVDAALTAVRLLRDALPGVGFAVEHEGGFGHEPSYHPQWYDGDDVRIAAVEDLLDGPPTKLLLRIEGLGADAMLRTAREVLGDTVEVTHSNSRDGLVEVSASGVSKATTLAELCAERGLSAADVLAFGDMPNDLPLLAWAGTAYAVANAHPDVLAAVDRRTASNDDDGVARILEEFFGPGSGAAA
ncbi:HAD family hydrolase [soil metagenome]